MPEEHRALFTGEPISVIWYPLEPWTLVLDTVREWARARHGEDAATFDREQMYACSSLTMTNVYRVVFRLFSPRTVIEKVTPYFNRVFSHGEHVVVENCDGRCILRFRDAPLAMRREIERSFPLAAEWMLDLARQEITHHELAPTVRNGTYSCDLVVHYRAKAHESAARDTQAQGVATPVHRS